MTRTRTARRTVVAGLVGIALAAGLALPTAAQATPAAAPTVTKPAAPLPKLPTAPVVRIGFFANVTHAPALVAQQLRLFEAFLGKDGTKVEYTAFNAGPAVVEAMKGGAIDVSYIGPNPSISGYTSTGGTLLRVVSGVDLAGRPVRREAEHQLGRGPQGQEDRHPAARQHPGRGAAVVAEGQRDCRPASSGGGDVTIVPTDNATTLTLFKRGDLDGAWLPEPWASRLVIEAGAKVLLDEKSLWPGGQFVTTQIIAAQPFLAKYPGTVRSILQANNSAIKYIAANVTKSKDVVQEQITKWTGKPLPDAVITRSWGNLRFTWDPLPLTLTKSADDAVNAGLLTLGQNKLAGIYDLRLLNSVLKAAAANPCRPRPGRQ